MRHIVLVLSAILLTVGCRKEPESTAAPAKKLPQQAVTTTAPPVTIEGEKTYSVGFAQPDLLGAFVVGKRSGSSMQPATEFRAADVIVADVTLKEVPKGLAATLEIVGSDGKPVYSDRRIVGEKERRVSFEWREPKKEGDYTARLLLGGDQYDEARVKIVN